MMPFFGREKYDIAIIYIIFEMINEETYKVVEIYKDFLFLFFSLFFFLSFG